MDLFFRPLFESNNNDKFELTDLAKKSALVRPDMYKNGIFSLIDDRSPIEAIMVCFDCSYSMEESCFNNAKKDSIEEMERIQCAKIFFNAFVNRSNAYDVANHVG